MLQTVIDQHQHLFELIYGLSAIIYPTAVVADLSIVCAAEREVRGSIPVWEYELQ